MTIKKIHPLAALLALLLAAGHFLFLLQYEAPAYASPDASGYFVQARVLADEGHTWVEPSSPVQYLGIHWLKANDGRFFSRYPPGLSFLLAPVFHLWGYQAALLVIPVLASLTLWLLFLLCAPWLGSGLALCASLTFALNPTANFHALHADSHTAATAFLVAGFLLLDRWTRRPGAWRGLLAGLLLGALPAIRYPEAVCAIGVVLFLGTHLWRQPVLRNRLPFVLIGAALPVMAMLLRNHLAFGAPWRTGYSLTNEQSGFSLQSFLDHAVPYLESLGGSGVGALFGLGLAGFCAMLCNRAARPLGLLLLGASVPSALVYMAYYWGFGGGALRFFLPTMPLYVLGGFWLLARLNASAPRAGWPAALALVVLAAATGVPESLRRLDDEATGARNTAAVAGWATENIPQGSLIIADRRLQEFLDYVGRWRLVDANLLGGFGGGFGGRPRGRAIAAGFRRDGAASERPSPRQVGRETELRKRYQGLDPDRRAFHIADDVLAWAGKDRAIYWIGRQQEVDRFVASVADTEALSKIGEITMPPVPPRENPGRGGPGGRRGFAGRLRRGGFGRPGGGLFRLPNDGRPLGVYRWER